VSDTPKATPGVCANRKYASIGGRCCAHCGQQIHHDGNDWRHIATKQAACAPTTPDPDRQISGAASVSSSPRS
jgi:hypothetical protein